MCVYDHHQTICLASDLVKILLRCTNGLGVSFSILVIHFRRFALLSCVRFEKSIIQKCPSSKEEIKIRNCCAYSPKLRNYKLHHPSSIQILRNPILSSSCLVVEWLSLINVVLYKKKTNLFKDEPPLTDSSLTVARLINCIKHASNLSFIFVDLWFIFIFPQTTWSISQMLQQWIRQERLADNRISFKSTPLTFLSSVWRVKIQQDSSAKKWGLKAKCQQVLFCVFPGLLNNWCRALFKNNIFPPKKIQALFYNCFSVTSVWKLFNFSRQKT